MPDAGVIALEKHPDWDHAFRPAAPLVAVWRQLLNMFTGGRNPWYRTIGSSVRQSGYCYRLRSYPVGALEIANEDDV